jgi:hypothetical protein
LLHVDAMPICGGNACHMAGDLSSQMPVSFGRSGTKRSVTFRCF